MSVNPIPAGYSAVIPYLLVEGVADLIPFLIEAFQAKLEQRLDRPDGSIMHAEVRIGDSVVLMGEPNPEFGAMPASIYLDVEDCDKVYARAVQAGGKPVMEPSNMVHAGERYCGLLDLAGNLWWVATHVEDLPPEEQAARVASLPQDDHGRITAYDESYHPPSPDKG